MTASDDRKYTAGWTRIIRYESARDFEEQDQLSYHFEEIEGHIERNIGPVQSVYHEVVSDMIHLDILVVPANSDRRFHYLVTSGMSDLAMQVSSKLPEGDAWRFSELVIALPSYWPVLDENAMQQKKWSYPVDHLKFLARMPHKFGSWLSIGHSIPHFDSSKPIGPECKMSGFVLDYPILGGENFTSMETRDGKTIRFYAVYPVHNSEMQYKLRKGYPHLRKLFVKNFVTEIFDPKRENLARNRWRHFVGL